MSTAHYQKWFVCTKRSRVGFFREVSRVLHVAVIELRTINRQPPQRYHGIFPMHSQVGGIRPRSNNRTRNIYLPSLSLLLGTVIYLFCHDNLKQIMGAQN